jgi:hypothetical protein
VLKPELLVSHYGRMAKKTSSKEEGEIPSISAI